MGRVLNLFLHSFSELGWFCTARPFRQKCLTPEPNTTSTKQSTHSSCRAEGFDLPVLPQTAVIQSRTSHSPKGAATSPCPRRGDLKPREPPAQPALLMLTAFSWEGRHLHHPAPSSKGDGGSERFSAPKENGVQRRMRDRCLGRKGDAGEGSVFKRIL